MSRKTIYFRFVPENWNIVEVKTLTLSTVFKNVCWILFIHWNTLITTLSFWHWHRILRYMHTRLPLSVWFHIQMLIKWCINLCCSLSLSLWTTFLILLITFIDKFFFVLLSLLFFLSLNHFPDIDEYFLW